ncbi:hypothetical protein VA7868_00879 [Vibrio aerogenes CECT 7868]|uniref:Uncharacterized protein n=1 Tax=Vibrio aerogenes CECT 7868 TaxID=1216006 RepID=A0A1M5WUK1_9VIBR|nr:hypothetical protein [Vibrio aerogenes]SHH91286.1 hypothetical protein VA7868_00879 [Vibrio aerogenes CECT 7868]
MSHSELYALTLLLLPAFTYNLLISLLATVAGIPTGWVLSLLSLTSCRWFHPIARLIQSVFCNVPSFVLLFYLTMIMPSHLELFSFQWQLSPLIKTVIALAIPVTGYSCDAFIQQHQGHKAITLAALKQFFIVILMASTTASVIGVKEILATANMFIASAGHAGIMLPVYGVVTFIFVLSGLLIQLIFAILKHRFIHKITSGTTTRAQEINHE